MAGYDDLQMVWVLSRPRSKTGQLLRTNPDLPTGVHVDEDGMRVVKNVCSMERAVTRAWKDKGVDDDLAGRRWSQFRKSNPHMGKGGKKPDE